MIVNKNLVLSGILLLSSALASHAATVTTTESDSIESRSLYGLSSDTAAYGHHMVGSVMTATYDDNSSEEFAWVSTGRWTGAAFGSFMSITYDAGEFIVSTTKRMTSMVFNAGASGTIFDTRPNGTAGSSWGFPYQEGSTGILDGLIDVDYYGLVEVSGDTNEPSIFTHMAVDYSGTTGGGLFGTTSFITDLDILEVSDDLQPVPLPNSLPLAMAGVLGLGFLRTRRKTK